MTARLIPALAAAAGAAAVSGWVTATGPAVQLSLRQPGADGRPATAGVQPALDIAQAGRLEVLGGTPADLPGVWPGFRGRDFPIER